MNNLKAGEQGGVDTYVNKNMTLPGPVALPSKVGIFHPALVVSFLPVGAQQLLKTVGFALVPHALGSFLFPAGANPRHRRMFVRLSLSFVFASPRPVLLLVLMFLTLSDWCGE